MADPATKATDAPEKFSWKLFLLLIAGAVGFISAAIILAP